MIEFCKNEWCDRSLTESDEEDGQCAHCAAEQAKAAAYWRKQYDREPRYTREEIDDVYSGPTDEHKREVMFHELGL